MQDHHIVSKGFEFEHSQGGRYHVSIMLFLEYTEGKNKNRIPFIDRDQAVIATFIDVDDVVAVFWTKMFHVLLI